MSRLPLEYVDKVRTAATSQAVAACVLGVELAGDGTGRCPLHDDATKSFQAHPPNGSDGGGWICYAGCGQGGDGISLYARAKGLDPRRDFPEIVRQLGDVLNVPNPRAVTCGSGGGRGHHPVATTGAAPSGNGRHFGATSTATTTAMSTASAAPALWTPSREPDPGELRHPQHGEPSVTWRVCDASGRLFALHARFDPPPEDGKAGKGKTFAWWRSGAWKLGGGVGSKDAPLYRSEGAAAFDPSRPLFLVEGEKAADALAAIGAQVLATVSGAGVCPGDAPLAILKGWPGPIVPWADNDPEKDGRRGGVEHMVKVRSALQRLGASDVRPPWIPEGLPPKGDAVEWIAQRSEQGAGDGDALRAALEGSLPDQEAASQQPRLPLHPPLSFDLRTLLRTKVEPREPVVANLLYVAEPLMLIGAPGARKSWLAAGLGMAIAAGNTEFLGRAIPRPRGVLYVDAEQSLAEAKDRDSRLFLGLRLGRGAVPFRHLIVNGLDPEHPAIREGGFPDLGTERGRELIETELTRPDISPRSEVLILDSARLLFDLGDENKSESWSPVNRWLGRLCSMGITPVLLHHGNRRDDFNGHMASITRVATALLITAEENSPTIRVSFRKHRSIPVTAAKPFTATLEDGPDGSISWTFTAGKAKREDCWDFWNSGGSMDEAIKEFSVKSSTAYRWKDEGLSAGTLRRDPTARRRSK